MVGLSEVVGFHRTTLYNSFFYALPPLRTHPGRRTVWLFVAEDDAEADVGTIEVKCR